VTPTRPGVLVQLVLGFGLLVYVLAALAYAELPRLPGYAPVSIVLLAVAEVGIARVVRDRVTLHQRQRAGAPARGRTLHPVQVARAAVLAKRPALGRRAARLLRRPCSPGRCPAPEGRGRAAGRARRRAVALASAGASWRPPLGWSAHAAPPKRDDGSDRSLVESNG
jgi:hypothetical protein